MQVSVMALTLTLVLSACAVYGEGVYVAENGASDQPESLYLILDSEPGGPDESGGDPDIEYPDDCLVYEIHKTVDTDLKGQHIYEGDRGSLSNPTTTWVVCQDYEKRSKPPLVINFIPAEFRVTAGIKGDFSDL